jgi:hypothetical protein
VQLTAGNDNLAGITQAETVAAGMSVPGGGGLPAPFAAAHAVLLQGMLHASHRPSSLRAKEVSRSSGWVR